MRRMRVALMVTCVNDALFPDTGQGGRDAAAPARRRRGVPGGADLLRAADGQHRLPRRGGAGGAHLRRRVRRVRRGRGAVGLVRGIGAAPALDRRAPLRATRRWSAAVAETAPKVYELSEFLVDVLGVTDVGAYFPHRVTYHPTCHSLRMLGVGDRPLRLLRGGARADAGRPARRAEECCGFGGTFAVKNADISVAMGADKARHVRETGAEVLVRRRQLLPDAHRRAAVAAARRRAGDAPGRDPGRHRGRPVRRRRAAR